LLNVESESFGGPWLVAKLYLPTLAFAKAS